MKPMIWTSCAGTRRRSSPARSSRGSVVAASRRLASTPKVALVTSAAAATRPGWLTMSPPSSTRGPLATHGSTAAKTSTGVSMTIRRAR